MIRLIIDTDPGVDDAHAILLACAQVGVEAITTVAGNIPVEKATLNALKVLEVAGKDIPVYPGCPDALVTPTPRRAISHGADGLGDSGYPEPSRRPESEHAVQALIRLANESPGELTLAAIGPLTNIALATQLDPALPQKFKRLVVMGGAIHAKGNSWERAAEFNFYCDPEAAAVVFQAWPGLTLVPWETTLAHALTAAQVEALARGSSPRAKFFQRTVQKRFREGAEGQRVVYEPDPLALAVAIEPEIVQRQESHYIEIELTGKLTRGQSVIDWYHLTGRPNNATVVLEVDQERFFELLRQSLE
jgi:purine nucleosidase